MLGAWGMDVLYVYEPLGAAFSYASRLDRPATVLVADFGGGTTDFSVVSIGESGTARRCRPLAAAGVVRRKGPQAFTSDPLLVLGKVIANPQAKRIRAVTLERRRIAKPIAPKPTIISAQVVGSGTPPVTARLAKLMSSSAKSLNGPPPSAL